MEPYSLLAYASLPHSGNGGPTIQQNARNQRLPPKTLRRIALVDGDESHHLTVKQTFENQPDKWVLEWHPSAKEALRQISLAPPHIVIVELALLDCSGIDFLLKLKSRLPDLPVLIFTECHKQHEVELCLMAGANGFLVKPLPERVLLRALRDALAGRVALCEKANAVMVDSFQRVSRLDLFQNLSPHERAILVYVLNGFCDKEIALHQKKPTETVHAHLVNIYHKLGVNSRKEVLKKFFRAMQKT